MPGPPLKAQERAINWGKFGYVFMLDAQRILFDAKIQHLDALTTYQPNAG